MDFAGFKSLCDLTIGKFSEIPSIGVLLKKLKSNKINKLKVVCGDDGKD